MPLKRARPVARGGAKSRPVIRDKRDPIKGRRTVGPVFERLRTSGRTSARRRRK